MKRLDRFIQRLRIDQAIKWIPNGSRVLDVGCHNGALFERLGERIEAGIGLDPELGGPLEVGRARLIPGSFPDALEPLATDPFDVITLLAVLEHIPDGQKGAVAGDCHRLLRPGGRVVLTIPSAHVDKILVVLLALRLIDGMSLEEHHGFDPLSTPAIFAGQGFEPEAAQRFQFGLNHLFVFRRPADA